MIKIWIFFVLSILVSLEAKQRVIILTDISEATQEPDDIESMVRLMLYSNELDIEGLIATSSCWRKNDPLRPDLIEDVVEAYGEVRPNLLLHDDGYPTSESLQQVVRSGNEHGMSAVGNGKTSPGSQLIEEVVDKADGRPVWVCVWGGAATLAQTLYDVNEVRNDTAVDQFVSRLRVYDLSGQDDAGAWICHNFPDIFYIRSQVQWRGFSYRLDNLWNESRGPNEELVAPAWFTENVTTGHGALGSMYAPAKYLHEGDTPTFLNLLDNGLSADPDSGNFGGWGGRFAVEKQKNVRTGSDNATVIESGYDDYYMFTDATDRWADGGEDFDNSYCAVFRWRKACQNDFAARMDWCVNAYADANHRPEAVVNGDEGSGTIYITAAAGTSIQLDASASGDPDGDQLNFTWQVYQEAGTYDGAVSITGASSSQPVVTVPDDCEGKTIHVLLSVMDSGEPVLFSYRRVVVAGERPDVAGNGMKRKSVLKPVTGRSVGSSCLLNGQKVTLPSAKGIYVPGKRHVLHLQ